jgi:hypothetical protein
MCWLEFPRLWGERCGPADRASVYRCARKARLACTEAQVHWGCASCTYGEEGSLELLAAHCMGWSKGGRREGTRARGRTRGGGGGGGGGGQAGTGMRLDSGVDLRIMSGVQSTRCMRADAGHAFLPCTILGLAHLEGEPGPCGPASWGPTDPGELPHSHALWLRRSSGGGQAARTEGLPVMHMAWAWWLPRGVGQERAIGDINRVVNTDGFACPTLPLPTLPLSFSPLSPSLAQSPPCSASHSRLSSPPILIAVPFPSRPLPLLPTLCRVGARGSVALIQHASLNGS